MGVEYDSDNILQTVDEMQALLRRASSCLRQGASAEEPLELSTRAIGLAVDMDPEQFVGLAPQSMVSLLEITGSDGRIVMGVADALDVQAEVLDSQGSLIEASVRREQAAALRASIDPARAN